MGDHGKKVVHANKILNYITCYLSRGLIANDDSDLGDMHVNHK